MPSYSEVYDQKTKPWHLEGRQPRQSVGLRFCMSVGLGRHLENCRVQGDFFDLPTPRVCNWVEEVGLEQGLEEAARPLSHPETIPVPNHGNPWSLHGLGYPGHSPTHPGIPQITMTLTAVSQVDTLSLSICPVFTCSSWPAPRGLQDTIRQSSPGHPK